MLARVFGWILAIGSTAVSAIKLALWVIGTSTVVEDVSLLPEKAQVMMEFIGEQPGWAFYGFFVVLAVLGLWLALRKPSTNSPTQQPDQPHGGVTSFNQSGGITAHTVNGANDVGKRE